MLKEDNDKRLHKPSSKDETSDKEDNMGENIDSDYKADVDPTKYEKDKKWNDDKFEEELLDGDL